MKRKSPNRRQSSSSDQSVTRYQSLEPRQLLAGISFNSATGVVTIDGSGGDDVSQVTMVGNSINVSLNGVPTQSMASSQVTEIVYWGRNGDDWFRNNTAITTRAFGHGGHDSLIGGSSNDVLRGGDGDDRLLGNSGNDLLFGDSGVDQIWGHDGFDYADGGDGDDRIWGGAQGDTLRGGNGIDNIQGEDGNDNVAGHHGDDWLHGGNGDDSISGNTGLDRIIGFAGNDRMWGGDDNDVISGDDGDDFVVGGFGDDSIYGHNGIDDLSGNEGLDTIYGGAGNDLLRGGIGNDSLYGQLDDDILRGESGDDRLNGASGNDDLFGDDGHDTIIGGPGDDRGRGGRGIDHLFGDDGRDDLNGDDDQDKLTGGLGVDRMVGGFGNDDYFRDSSDDVFDSPEDYQSNGDFEIRGNISNLNTTAKTLSILGITINYASARVEGNLAIGVYFKAEGTFSNGVVTAFEVEQKDPTQQTDNFEARGSIANLNTTAKTFSFLGVTVNYANAEINTSLQDGAFVKVEGNLSNGVVAAREVENGLVDDNQSVTRNFELRGALSDLNTAAKTFNLLGVPVNYSVAQVIGNLSAGSLVKVTGNYNNGILTASEVQIELPDDRDENVEATGAISNLITGNRTFTILGFTVGYSNADVETGLANGAVISVEGWFANAVIAAERIR